MSRPRTAANLVRLVSVLTTASIAWFFAGVSPAANAVTTLASGRAGYLYDVAAITTTDAWAVGTAGNHTTMALHWDGVGWSKITTPSPGSSATLLGSAAVSSTDVWAVGSSLATSTSTSNTLSMHWNGFGWATYATPSPGADGQLSAVDADSSSDAWAVGSYKGTSGAQTLALHWNGTKWSTFATPDPGSVHNSLSSVTVISPSDVWAVGSYSKTAGQSRNLTLHWNGASWSIVPSPNAGPDGLTGVSATGSKNVWAVGNYQNNFSYRQDTLILHWDGATWTEVPSPNPGTRDNKLAAVSTDARSDAWAVGQYFDTTNNTWDTLTLHWDGTTWSAVPAPNPGTGSATGNGSSLSGVSALSSTYALAAGTYYTTFHETLGISWGGSSWTEV